MDDAPADAPADEPFGAVADPFGADAAPPAENPHGRPPGRPPRRQKDRRRQPRPRPTDPAVLAVLESKPKTPAELLRAIGILVDLDESALAKPFVDELGQRTLDPAAKTALVDAFNPATLLKLARHPELGVELGPLVDDWLRSAEEYRRDPARLAAATEQLSDPNEAHAPKRP